MSACCLTFAILGCICILGSAATAYNIGVLDEHHDAAATYRRWGPTFDTLLNTYASNLNETMRFNMTVGGFLEIEHHFMDGHLDFAFVDAAIAAKLVALSNAVLVNSIEILRAYEPVFLSGGAVLTHYDNTHIQQTGDCDIRSVCAISTESITGFIAQVYEYDLQTHTRVDYSNLSFMTFTEDADIAMALANNKTCECAFVHGESLAEAQHYGRNNWQSLRLVDQKQGGQFRFYRFPVSTDLYPEWFLIAQHQISLSTTHLVASILETVRRDHPEAQVGQYSRFFPPFDITETLNLLYSTGVLTRQAPPTGLSGLQIALVSLGITAAVVAALVVVKFALQTRDVDNAPKDPNAPCTIIFTDIQKSTRLWGACPDEMAEAVEAHHAIIRKEIKKYRAYEVKTIGDSFMIACKDSKTAIELSLAIQLGLHNHRYPDDTIDQQYAALAEEERCFQAIGGAVASPILTTGKPSAGSSKYATPFHGLLVRIGVHCGMANIKFDEVSKGYDYYGPTVNTAARTEAVGHGGQIVVTAAVLNGLNRDTIGIDHVCTDLGSQELRDVTEPLELFQFLPMELSGRTFPPLRVEHGAADEEEGVAEGNDTSTSHSSAQDSGISSGGKSNHAVTAANDHFFLVLKKCLSVLKKSERKSLLQKISTRWGLPADNDEMGMRGCVFKAKKALLIEDKLASSMSGTFAMHLGMSDRTNPIGQQQPRLEFSMAAMSLSHSKTDETSPHAKGLSEM